MAYIGQYLGTSENITWRLSVKVGDLIKNKTRYVGLKFLVIGIRDQTAVHKQVRAVRIVDGFKTRWSNIESWEVTSEGR